MRNMSVGFIQCLSSQGELGTRFATVNLFDCLSECPQFGLIIYFSKYVAYHLIILSMKKLKHQTDFNLEIIYTHFLSEQITDLSFLTEILCISYNCCIISHPQTRQLKTAASNYYLIVLCVMNSGVVWLSSFGSGFLMTLSSDLGFGCSHLKA